MRSRFSVFVTAWLVGICRLGTVRYGTLRYGTVRYGTVRYGTVRYGTVRYGIRLYSFLRRHLSRTLSRRAFRTSFSSCTRQTREGLGPRKLFHDPYRGHQMVSNLYPRRAQALRIAL